MSSPHDSTNDSVPWFDRNSVLTTMLVLAGIALLLWLLSRKGGAPLAISAALEPESLVSAWSPLQ